MYPFIKIKIKLSRKLKLGYRRQELCSQHGVLLTTEHRNFVHTVVSSLQKTEIAFTPRCPPHYGRNCVHTMVSSTLQNMGTSFTPRCPPPYRTRELHSHHGVLCTMEDKNCVPHVAMTQVSAYFALY